MTRMSSRLISLPAQALRWWLRELRDCIPGWRAGASSRRWRSLIVWMQEQGTTFQHRSGRAQTELGYIPANPVESSSAQKLLSKVRRTARAWRTDTVLCLRSDDVLRLKVALPLATLDNLREVLGFEMERLTAFKAEEVYYAHRVIDTNQADKRLSVLLIVVPRAIANASMELIRSWGLKPDIVTASSGDMAIDPAMNLLPKQEPAHSARSLGRVLTALGVITLSLAIVIVHLEVRQQTRLLTAYEARLAESRAAALRVEKLKAQESELLTRTRYVAQRKQAQPMVSEVLNEVTQLLPDNTWVSQFQMRGGEVTFSGYSAAASALVEGLEAAQMLSQVRFTSPITSDTKLGVERFNLTAAVANTGEDQ